MLADVHGLACAKGLQCPSDTRDCTEKAGNYLGQAWTSCPVRECLEDPFLQAILRIDAQARVSSLSGWPDEWAAWVPNLLAEWEAVKADRRRNEEAQ